MSKAAFTFIALMSFAHLPSASAKNCETAMVSAALDEARKIDSTGNFSVATAYQFPQGPYRVVINDGPHTINVDVVLDSTCRVLSIDGSSDIDNANGN